MIGIFDSGSGGLTVLSALREELPSADVVYFGDIKNAPYGSRSREDLSNLTVAALQLLKKEGAERIVSACNSVSASLAVSLFDAFSLAPNALIEMVGPTVAAFKGSHAHILLAATPATIESQIYQSAFRMMGMDIQTLAIPELAGAIEFGTSEAELDDIVAPALAGRKGFDALVLACTHYPLALSSFQKALPGVPIFDPAHAVAERAKAQFWPQEVGDGTTRFLISANSPHFRAFITKLFPAMKFSIEVL